MVTIDTTIVTVNRIRVHDGPFLPRHVAKFAVRTPTQGWLAVSRTDAIHFSDTGRTVARVLDDKWKNDGVNPHA